MDMINKQILGTNSFRTTNILKIKQSLKEAEELYHRLVLLVGDTGSGKTNILREIANDFSTSVINVNLALSRELLELTIQQRSLQLPRKLNQITGKTQTLLVLDNLEILFDKNLNQDPLRLLKAISRNRSVLASWNGTHTRGKITYAEIGHPEYRCYDADNTMFVCIDN